MHKLFLVFLLLGVRLQAATGLYRDSIEPHWFDGNQKFWYRLETGENEKEFVLVDAVKGNRREAFDHAALAAKLSERLKERISPAKLPIDSLSFENDLSSIDLHGSKGDWKWIPATGDLREGKAEPAKEAGRSERRERPASRAESRDGKWEVRVKGHNLELANVETGKKTPLTYDGTPSDSYEKSVEHDRGVGMQFDAKPPESPAPVVFWSPDSKHFVAMRTRAGTKRDVFLVQSSPADQLQPKLQSYPYLKPGDDIPISKPHLFDAENGREIPLDDALFRNPWSISDIRWSKNSERFTFLFNQRGHQVLRLLAVDAANGAVLPLIDEQSKTFVCYSSKYFCEQLQDSQEIIWMSERDGWNHLYLFDGNSGRLKNQITKGEWVVRAVDRVDSEKRQIWFRAGGIRPGQDPYYLHSCRVDFDGRNLTMLTEADGTHSVQYSPDRRFLIDSWSRVDLPARTELRSGLDGRFICFLEDADTTGLFSSEYTAPVPFHAPGRDGATEIYGVIHFPKNFDASRKYPIIESIYAGPHDSFVPKNFRRRHNAERLTKLGFFVVQIDGMGTSNRSKKFHDVCWKNIGDSGFPDRVLWIKAAAKVYPAMDLERVGIYGTSAGGQSSLRGMLTHGDFYKAAVSDCGCHDNRMDKIWWNEQWMGWPLGPHYAEQSNVTQAHKLQGKLLLLVGEMDKNVDPSSTMQVVNALVKAGKPFDFLMMPGMGHGVLSTDYGWKKLETFFASAFPPREP